LWTIDIYEYRICQTIGSITLQQQNPYISMYAYWSYIVQFCCCTTYLFVGGAVVHQSVPKQSSKSSKASSSSYWCNEDHEDYVHTIPGYIPVQPPSCWYSGYVSYEIAGQLIHTHYTLQTAELISSSMESNVQNNAFQKPLIYWSSYVLYQQTYTIFVIAFTVCTKL
jgi:hypothetical protein